jgi:hypothetical protein
MKCAHALAIWPHAFPPVLPVRPDAPPANACFAALFSWFVQRAGGSAPAP